MLKRYLVNPGLKIRNNGTTNFIASTRLFEAEANYFIVISERAGGMKRENRGEGESDRQIADGGSSGRGARNFFQCELVKELPNFSRRANLGIIR